MITIRWKSIQKKIVPVVLGLIFILSMSIQNSTPSHLQESNTLIPNREFTPLASQLDYEIPITGQGNSQNVYLYMQNHSIATGVNEFNISSEIGDYYLHDGTFNFTMQKNHLTNFTLESDDSLHYEKYKTTISTTSDMFTVVTGTENVGADFISVDSALAGENIVELNVAIDASSYLYNTSTILGFKIQLAVQADSNLGLDTSLYNYISSSFDTLESDRIIQEISGGYRTITYYIRNENLNYVNSTKDLEVKLHFSNATETFTLLVDSMQVDVIEGYETNFGANNPIALEFDVRGDSTIYGFQAWIRALDIDDSVTSNLTIQLCQANISEPIARSALLDPTNAQLLATPDETAILSEITLLNYSVDRPMWFNLTTDHSGIDVSVGNYFIIISANTTSIVGETRFSLVSIPYDAPINNKFDPDQKVDHLLLSKSANWEIAEATFHLVTTTIQADASNFAINLSRPYNPSEIGLTVDDVPVEDTYIWDYPHDRLDGSGNEPYYASYWWGYGTVKLEFSTPIALSNGNFTVSLDWDHGIYSGDISFSVEYIVQKYLVDSAVGTFELSIDYDPAWNLTYTFDPNDNVFTQWNFTKFGYLFPSNWEIADLQKNGTSILELSADPYSLDGKTMVEINSTVADTNTTYILSTISPNYLRIADLYLKYNDNLWKTHGFMQGDVIALSAGLLTSYDTYLPNDGKITAQIFNTTGNLVASSVISDNSVDDNSSYSWFNFGESAIMMTDENTPIGEYTVILNWTDGDQLGFMKTSFYVNEYQANIHSSSFIETTHTNRLFGTITPFTTDLNTFNFTIFAVKPLINNEKSFLVNETDEIFLGQDLYLTNYALNETVINPNEDITVAVQLENRHSTLDYNVTVTATLIYAENHKWEIGKTSLSALLPMYGQPDNSHEHLFMLNLTIPDEITGGLNCPLRNMPMQMKITVNIDDEEIDESIKSQLLYYSSLNENEFEGKILTTRTYNDFTGPSFTSDISRNLLDLPGNVTYFIQVYNSYFMTMAYESNFTTVDNKIYGIFSDVLAETSPIDHYSTQTISGKFVDENNEILQNTELLFYYDARDNLSAQEAPIWTTLQLDDSGSTALTDENGQFEISFDMSQTPLLPEVQFMVKFQGNSTFAAVNHTITISKNIYEQNLEINMDSSKTLVKGEHNLINAHLVNLGNASYTNVTISLVSDYDARINLKKGLNIFEISTGESYGFSIDFYDKSYDLDSLTINISVSAVVKETGENYTVSATFTFNTYEVNTHSILVSIFIGVFIVGVVGLWLYSAYYIKNQIKEINAPVAEEEVSKQKKRRRGGKYVNLAELSTKKDKDVKTPSDEKGTSLDELLNEEKQDL